MRKTIKAAIIPFIVLLFSLVGFAQELGIIHSEAAGGFRYVMPKGWTIAEFPGMKFKIARGFQADGFTPNISVFDESFSGSVEDYANANLKQIETIFQNFKNLGKSVFITNSGLKGIRLATEATQMGNHLRQTFYFFKGKAGKMLVVTGSVLAKDGDRFSGLFDASMKTFEVK
jgi:hypothetical protein